VPPVKKPAALLGSASIATIYNLAEQIIGGMPACECQPVNLISRSLGATLLLL
jgi:hypothetical protein